MKKFIKIVLPYNIRLILIKYLLKLNPKIFVKVYNVISFLFYRKNYIFLSENKNNLFVKEKNFIWNLYNNRGSFYYLKGLDFKGKFLAEQYLIDDIVFQENDVVIDCGANFGDLYLFFINKNINYYAYEPSPYVFNILKGNVKNQNIFNYALHKDNSKKIDFFLKDDTADSSTIEIKNYDKKITVSATTLDHEIDKIIPKKIKLIKIEAEGAEPEVLEGLLKNLETVEYITIDVSYERGLKEESTLVDCSNYLIRNDFELIKFSQIPRLVVLFKNKNSVK